MMYSNKTHIKNDLTFTATDEKFYFEPHLYSTLVGEKKQQEEDVSGSGVYSADKRISYEWPTCSVTY